MQALSLEGNVRWIVRIVLIAFILAFPIGRFIDAVSRCKFSYDCTMIGSIWLGVMLYAFLFLILIDIYRITDYIFHISPKLLKIHPVQTKQIAFFFIFLLIVILLSIGYHNARNFRINKVEIALANYPANKSSLNIVHLSDIHLGTIINKSRLIQIVEQVNQLSPDLVLITGDLVDENVARIADLVQPLSKIHSKLGAFAVTGNHEVYAGVDKAAQFMRAGGITVLRNSSVTIDSIVNIVGLDDRAINSRLGSMEKILHASLTKIDRSLPTILMNHQPVHLEAAEAAGIDLQLSGHTHNGQLFPLNLITKLVYQVSSGYRKIGNMHIYVSNGVGTWGPPIRLGAPPEIVQISLGRTS